MQKNIRVMVFLKPPVELNDSYYEIHKFLRKNFNSTYRTFYKKKWNSHIRLFGGTFYQKDHTQILELIGKTLNDANEIDVAFSKHVYKDGYLMLMTDQASNKVCKTINEKLFSRLNQYKSSFIRKKYKANKLNLSEENLTRLKETGTIYEYDAHLSLAAFENNSYKLKDFERILDFEELLAVKFNCNEYFVEISDIDYKHKSIHGPFKLGVKI